MKKILITGGSGFIGTNLITKLAEGDNYIILNIDIDEPKLDKHQSFFLKIDLRDKKKITEAILSFNPHYVIHLAARTDLNGKSLNDYDSNILGVESLLEALSQLSDLERVIFASSMYVCQPGYTPNHFEDYKPHTIYGESKVLTEKIIKKKDPNYIWSIIRPTSIWGPHFGEPYNLFFKIVLSKKYFHMGKKACKKTYGYIDNFIYQLLSILEADKTDVDKGTFYLGDYQPYDITSWADEIAGYAGIKIYNIPYALFKIIAVFGDCLKTVGINFPMTSFRLKNMTTDNIFDLSPIKKIAPQLPVSRIKGTVDTVDWLKKH